MSKYTRNNLVHMFYAPKANEWILQFCFDDGIVFESNDKPKLTFEFDQLFYENSKISKNFFYIKDTVKRDMDFNEKKQVERFIDGYIKTELDYQAYAYDPATDNIYKGYMLTKEAKKLDFESTTVKPENLMSKFNKNYKKWETIHVIIMDDGTPILNPTNICQRCVLFYSKDEWDKIKPSDEDLNYVKWNFIDSTWDDTDTLENLQRNIDFILKTRYKEDLSDNKSSIFDIVDDLSLMLLRFDCSLLQNEKATPLLDKYMTLHPDMKKEEICSKLNENFNRYITKNIKTINEFNTKKEKLKTIEHKKELREIIKNIELL